MGEIWRFKRDMLFNLSGQHRAGQRLYKCESDIGGYIWYPIDKKTYPIWESDQFKWSDDDLEFVEATDKPKEYFIDVVVSYTQEQIDNKEYLNLL